MSEVCWMWGFVLYFLVYRKYTILCQQLLIIIIIRQKHEKKSKLCNRYLYLLNQCVYFRGCFVCLLLQVLLCFVHILLHFLPVHLHVATMIGDLWGGGTKQVHIQS